MDSTLLLSGLSVEAFAVDLPAVTVTTDDNGETSYSVTIQILALMTAITLLPSFVIMLTAFTRIVVVFAILRQAIGLQQTPSNQILVGIALFLSIFVMTPVLQDVQQVAIEPYMEEAVTPQQAVLAAAGPFKAFMLH